MKSTTKRMQRDYSLAFKLAVVDQVEKGEMTYQQAQELEETKLKADFFEAVVKVMDRGFGVRISKKRKAELLKSAQKVNRDKGLQVDWRDPSSILQTM